MTMCQTCMREEGLVLQHRIGELAPETMPCHVGARPSSPDTADLTPQQCFLAPTESRVPDQADDICPDSKHISDA